MPETIWILTFTTGYNNETIGRKIRELLVFADATSIHLEKFDPSILPKRKE